MFGRTLEVNFELGTKHLARNLLNNHHSTPCEKGRQRQSLPSSLGTLDATSKVSFHCGRQKRDIALGLVLKYRLSIHSKRLKNGNGNYYLGDKESTQTFFCTKFFDNPSGHGRPHRKSWTSAPESAFSCGPDGGEKFFDLGASGRKGQERPREIRTKKFMFMLFFLP